MKDSVKIALVTASLTGVFTIAASLATYWLTNTSPEMGYTLAGGPSFSTSQGAKRIYVLEISNSGSKEIKGTFVQLMLPNGEFSEVAADATPGVKISEIRTKSTFELRADVLNPDDTIKVSFLTAQQLDSSAPKIVVRAPGLNATDLSNKTETSTSSYLVAAFTIIAVLAQLLSGLVTTKFRKKRTDTSGARLSNRELSAYIFGVCGLQEEIPKIGVTLRSTADLLGVLGRSSEKYRLQTTVALKAHLLIEHMHIASLAVFRYHISMLSGQPMSDDEYVELRSKALNEGDDTLRWRAINASFIRDEMQKLAGALPDEDFLNMKHYFVNEPSK